MLTEVEHQEQDEGIGAPLQGTAGEAPCTAAAAREIAGITTTTTVEGDDCGQPAATRTTKVPPKVRAGRRDL